MGKAYYSKPKRIEKLSRKARIDLMYDLVYAFSVVKSPSDTAIFLQDLLTASEIKNLSKRLRIAKMLLSGATQREIAMKVHAGIATINKVNRWLERGGDGFKNVIEKLPVKWELPKRLPKGPIEFYLPQFLIALGQYQIAKKQGKKIEEIGGSLHDEAESKKLEDKYFQEAIDEYYKSLANSKKKSKFKEKL